MLAEDAEPGGLGGGLRARAQVHLAQDRRYVGSTVFSDKKSRRKMSTLRSPHPLVLDGENGELR